MTSNISNSPRYNMISKQLNLSDFNFEKNEKYHMKKIFKNENKLLKFIETTYQYAKITLNKYSNNFSKHLYTQPTLFTLLAMKIYTKSTYREITDLIEISDQIKKYLKYKKISTFYNNSKILQKTIFK